MSRRLRWLIAVPLVAVVVVVGGTWLYVNVISGDAPEELQLSSAPTTSASVAPDADAPTTTDGTWTVTSDSVAGYRVKEVLFGQDATAVGRTNDVEGSVGVAGSTVSTATFTVQMATVQSDQSRRDNQFRGRIMSTDQYPTATFALSSPIELASLPADGVAITAKATGDLTLRGKTRSVTFEVKAQRSGARLEINGSIPITFDEWGIPSPSFGPATVEDHGSLEFLLVLARS